MLEPLLLLYVLRICSVSNLICWLLSTCGHGRRLNIVTRLIIQMLGIRVHDNLLRKQNLERVLEEECRGNNIVLRPNSIQY